MDAFAEMKPKKIPRLLWLTEIILFEVFYDLLDWVLFQIMGTDLNKKPTYGFKTSFFALASVCIGHLWPDHTAYIT